MIAFACSRCGLRMQAKEELAGKHAKCPKCGQLVPIPADATVAQPAQPHFQSQTGPLPAPHQGQQRPGSPHPLPQAIPVSQERYDFLAPPQAPGEMGRLGPYRVLKVLGAGGMGVVFQAEDPHLGRAVALKAMKPEQASSSLARERFLREARATAAIKHEHIVTIFHVGEERGAPFLAMEFLEGEPLDDHLKREQKVPLREVLRIGREIAEGLAASHERGLIHRDLKPSNIWLEGRRQRVKILDFGLARGVADETHLTQSGHIVGTPAYMAPEQAQGHAVDARSDLFSLGCVLYRLCTGEAPFRGADPLSTIYAVVTEQPRLPTEVNAEVPSGLSGLVMKLLAKKQGERPLRPRRLSRRFGTSRGSRRRRRFCPLAHHLPRRPCVGPDANWASA